MRSKTALRMCGVHLCACVECTYVHVWVRMYDRLVFSEQWGRVSSAMLKTPDRGAYGT